MLACAVASVAGAVATGSCPAAATGDCRRCPRVGGLGGPLGGCQGHHDLGPKRAAATAEKCRGSTQKWATACRRVEPVELAVRRLHARVAPFVSMGGLGPEADDASKDARNRRKRVLITQTILKAIQERIRSTMTASEARRFRRSCWH